MLSRGEESCGEVGLNSGLSGFFMVGEDMSGHSGDRKSAEHHSLAVSMTFSAHANGSHSKRALASGQPSLLANVPQSRRNIYHQLTFALSGSVSMSRAPTAARCHGNTLWAPSPHRSSLSSRPNRGGGILGVFPGQKR